MLDDDLDRGSAALKPPVQAAMPRTGSSPNSLTTDITLCAAGHPRARHSDIGAAKRGIPSDLDDGSLMTELLDDDAPLPDDSPLAEEDPKAAMSTLRWRVLVVDDDKDVRTVSQLALQGVVVDGVQIELVCVDSAAAAREWLTNNHELAVALIDVVMESDTAGLDLVRWIREHHPDEDARLVLRTGQPGTAPEAHVMSSYDIHDYLSKAETTARRLVTSVTGAIRAWRDMRTIREQRAGLQRALRAVGGLFGSPGVEALLQAILDQVTALLFPRKSSLLFIATPGLSEAVATSPVVLAATGDFSAYVGLPVRTALGRAALTVDVGDVPAGRILLAGNRVLYAFDVEPTVRPILVIDGGDLLPWERELVELYCHAVTLALRNRRLWDAQLVWLQALEKFVPTGMSVLTGHADLRHVRAGDSATHQLTVCFVDVRGFTARTARSGGATAFRMLNALFAALGEVISAHGGIIDKYLGDGLLILFPDGPSRALHAALAMQRAAETVGKSEKEPLKIGVGLHHGEVLVGAVGYHGRLDLSVVSSVVNIASRVQDLTRTLDCDILFTDDIHRALDDADRQECRSLLTHKLRGDARPRVIWHAFGTAEAPARAKCRETAARLAEATTFAVEGKWDEVQARLHPLLEVGDPTIQRLTGHVERQLVEGVEDND